MKSVRGRALTAGAAILLPLAAGTMAVAGDAQLIAARIANFREIGTAFKQVNDELKSSQLGLARVREAVTLIMNRGAEIPHWFPPGSEPATSVDQGWFARIRNWLGLGETVTLPDEAKTRAKIEVWTAPAKFRKAHRNFMHEAEKLLQAANEGEITAISERFEALGKACEGCHEEFREDD